MLQSPLKGESAGLETSDAKGTLLVLCAGCIDQEQDVISQLSFQHRSQFYVALVTGHFRNLNWRYLPYIRPI